MPNFATVLLPDAPDVIAPDGSEVRLLASLPSGSSAEFLLHPGQVSVAVRHRTVSELWYVIGGSGQLWRSDAAAATTTQVAAGTSASIPVGTSFQFRNDGDVPLRILGVTMPPWPGDDEAELVPGEWQPSR